MTREYIYPVHVLQAGAERGDVRADQKAAVESQGRDLRYV